MAGMRACVYASVQPPAAPAPPATPHPAQAPVLQGTYGACGRACVPRLRASGARARSRGLEQGVAGGPRMQPTRPQI